MERGDFKGDPAAKKVSKKPLPFYGLQITPWPATVRRGCWENVPKETRPSVTLTPRVWRLESHEEPPAPPAPL